jgi:hypothetical protein
MFLLFFILFIFIITIYSSSLHVSSTSFTQTCIPDGHLHRLTYARYLINTIDTPDDEHRSARNMLRIEVNIYEEELCLKLVIYKN